MQTRREFINRGAMGMMALGLARGAYAEKAPPSAFGVQLYTVRELVKTDLPSTLAAIRKIGYRSVETFSAQYGGTSAKDLRTMILDADLKVPSAHFSYSDFGNRFEYAKELGVTYMNCGNTLAGDDTSLDGFKRTAHQYNIWGEQAKALGLRFSFHNHNVEFASFDGVTGIETLLKETDPALVEWQMDCYWVTQAGSDPVTLLKRYPNRIQSLHVKDRKPGFPPSTSGPGSQHFTEAGKGTLNWPAIWSAAWADGVRYFFVEQDTTEIPPLDSLKISYDYLSTHI